MSLPIGLYSILLRAPLALPFFFAVLSAKMLLYAGEIAERSPRIVMNASRFRTDIDSLPYLLPRSLPQLPRQVMSSAMKLQILVSLKAFVADLAHESVRCH